MNDKTWREEKRKNKMKTSFVSCQRSKCEYSMQRILCKESLKKSHWRWQAFRAQLLFFAVSEMSITDPMCAGGWNMHCLDLSTWACYRKFGKQLDNLILLTVLLDFPTNRCGFGLPSLGEQVQWLVCIRMSTWIDSLKEHIAFWEVSVQSPVVPTAGWHEHWQCPCGWNSVACQHSGVFC